jgi:hypothetical protein
MMTYTESINHKLIELNAYQDSSIITLYFYQWLTRLVGIKPWCN